MYANCDKDINSFGILVNISKLRIRCEQGFTMSLIGLQIKELVMHRQDDSCI